MPPPEAWTVVSRTRPRRHGAPAHEPCPAEPSSFADDYFLPAAASPDPGTTLSTLRESHARAQRWAKQDPSARALRAQVESCATRLVPLDSVVLIALGSLSSDGVTAADVDSYTSGKGAKAGKKGKQGFVITGGLTTTSMRQLVVVEGLIGILAAGGHGMKVRESTRDEEVERSEEGEAEEGTDEGDASKEERVFTVPGTWPDKGRLLVQDPRLNAMDAFFLAERGWTVLPSERWACEVERKSEGEDERQSEESYSALRSASPASSATSASPKDTTFPPLAPRPSSTTKVKAAHASSHLHSSSLFVAPHAPHSLVVQSLLDAERSSHGGVGLYIGNAVDEGFVTEKHARERKEEGREMNEWMGRRERMGKALKGGIGAMELHGLQVWASLRTEEDSKTDEEKDRQEGEGDRESTASK